MNWLDHLLWCPCCGPFGIRRRRRARRVAEVRANADVVFFARLAAEARRRRIVAFVMSMSSEDIRSMAEFTHPSLDSVEADLVGNPITVLPLRIIDNT